MKRDWGGGGWILWPSAILLILVSLWFVNLTRSRKTGRIGDGRDPASYGFDLGDLADDRDTLVSSGQPRDGIPSLDDPESMTVDAADALNGEIRGKYLVSGDRVIGVEIGGESRAYPVRVLNWHEVINDVLGGIPIAVTFSPLCDSVAVFDRRAAGEVLEFGVSGLLLDSNLLLFDRREIPGDSSLWSQLQGRAIGGPAAPDGRLDVLPASFTTWGHWRTERPATTVIRPSARWLSKYHRDPYGSYLNRGVPRFPVRPTPASRLPPMTPIMVVDRDGTRTIHPLISDPIPELTVGSPEPLDTPAGVMIGVILPPSHEVSTYYSRWFAWHAQHPDSTDIVCF